MFSVICHISCAIKLSLANIIIDFSLSQSNILQIMVKTAVEVWHCVKYKSSTRFSVKFLKDTPCDLKNRHEAQCYELCRAIVTKTERTTGDYLRPLSWSTHGAMVIHGLEADSR